MAAASGPSPASGQVLRIESDRPPLVVTLAETAVVGRDAASDVVVAHRTVSATHAKLTREGGAWSVKDLGSTNGLYVNGIRRDAFREVGLGDRDLIRLGDVVISVSFPGRARETELSRQRLQRVVLPTGDLRSLAAEFVRPYVRPDRPTRMPPANDELAERLGCSIKTVERGLRSLRFALQLPTDGRRQDSPQQARIRLAERILETDAHVALRD